jgi:hypothetical protein
MGAVLGRLISLLLAIGRASGARAVPGVSFGARHRTSESLPRTAGLVEDVSLCPFAEATTADPAHRRDQRHELATILQTGSSLASPSWCASYGLFS